MWSCILSVSACRGLIGLIGALGVVIGVIKIDSDYDNYGKSGSPIGNFFFFGGWVLFAGSVGLLNNNLSGFNVDFKALLGIVGSLLVIISASLSQLVMYKKNIMMMRFHLAFFIFSWIVTAYAISLPLNVAVADKNQLIRFIIALMGAIGVILGMVLQMQYRKRGLDFVETGKLSPGNSYSPGLPFFTAGWLFLAFANALL